MVIGLTFAVLRKTGKAAVTGLIFDVPRMAGKAAVTGLIFDVPRTAGKAAVTGLIFDVPRKTGKAAVTGLIFDVPRKTGKAETGADAHLVIAKGFVQMLLVAGLSRNFSDTMPRSMDYVVNWLGLTSKMPK